MWKYFDKKIIFIKIKLQCKIKHAKNKVISFWLDLIYAKTYFKEIWNEKIFQIFIKNFLPIVRFLSIKIYIFLSILGVLTYF